MAHSIALEIVLRKGKVSKNDRSAFLYLEPDGYEPGEIIYDEYARCGTCQMFTGDYIKNREKSATCTIVRPKNVTAMDTCGFYVPGANHVEMKGKETEAISKQDAAFSEDPSRCEECVDFDEKLSICHLFHRLNDKEPDTYDLDVHVKDKGCCNGQRAKFP